jgi:hypothetical protein
MTNLAIVWRNPDRIRTRCRRWLPQQPGSHRSYVIQELVSDATGVWANIAAFEVIPSPPATRETPRPWLSRLSW